VGDTPSIRGWKKVTRDISLVGPLDLGGNLMDGRHLTLEPSTTDPSNSLRMYGLMYGSTTSNRS
jgi:hypothetical protein